MELKNTLSAGSLALIRSLSDAFGPSGFEDDVVKAAREYAKDIGTIEEDSLRNLYLSRKENRGDRPVIMLDAHSDEVGFMIHSIKPNGTLRFVTLGRFSPDALSSADVLVRNRYGEYIPGIIAAKPPHFRTAAERSAGAPAEISSFVIDIGATSAEEAEKAFGIRIGEPGVPATRMHYDEEHGLLFGKAFDCRAGVFALLTALKELEGEELPCDVIGVLSSQEEVGERGAAVSVRRAAPDAAIVFEGCPADDTFTEPYAIQTALKRGPMFRFLDTSVICNPRFQRWTLDLAEARGLPAQCSVREGGGNDAAVIQESLSGIPSVVAGVPVRYIHSMNCITSAFDLNATAALAKEMLRSLTPEIIRGF